MAGMVGNVALVLDVELRRLVDRPRCAHKGRRAALFCFSKADITTAVKHADAAVDNQVGTDDE
jgi:hypothetical protein